MRLTLHVHVQSCQLPLRHDTHIACPRNSKSSFNHILLHNPTRHWRQHESSLRCQKVRVTLHVHVYWAANCLQAMTLMLHVAGIPREGSPVLLYCMQTIQDSINPPSDVRRWGWHLTVMSSWWATMQFPSDLKTFSFLHWKYQNNQ